MKKFKELRKSLNEKANSIATEQIPAPVLMLKRQGIRIFPDGRKVALYTNDHYNLVFTIPFGHGSEPITPVLGSQQ